MNDPIRNSDAAPDAVPDSVPINVSRGDGRTSGLPMCGDQGCVFTLGHQGPHSHYYTNPEKKPLT